MMGSGCASSSSSRTLSASLTFNTTANVGLAAPDSRCASVGRGTPDSSLSRCWLIWRASLKRLRFAAMLVESLSDTLPCEAKAVAVGGQAEKPGNRERARPTCPS